MSSKGRGRIEVFYWSDTKGGCYPTRSSREKRSCRKEDGNVGVSGRQNDTVSGGVHKNQGKGKRGKILEGGRENHWLETKNNQDL